VGVLQENAALAEQVCVRACICHVCMACALLFMFCMCGNSRFLHCWLKAVCLLAGTDPHDIRRASDSVAGVPEGEDR